MRLPCRAPRAERLACRRPVPAPVPALRQAGSTEVRKGDQIQNAGWLVTVIPATVATVKELLAPVQVPQFESLPDALTWWQTLFSGVSAVGGLIASHPWLAGTAIVGIVCVLIGRQLKSARLAKHQAGVPLSSQIMEA